MNTPKIATVIHCFYFEQMDAIVSFLKNIPFEFDFYASALPEKSETVQRLLQNAFPDKRIVFRTVPNRGFDIAPFICEFRELYPAYDLVLKLHTKKSPHTPWLRDWGNYLLTNVAGPPEIVNAILQMFSENKTLGLVYPAIIPALRQELTKDPWQEKVRVDRNASILYTCQQM